MNTAYKYPACFPKALIPVVERYVEGGTYDEMAFDLGMTRREFDGALTVARFFFPYICWRLFRRDCPAQQHALREKPPKRVWVNEQRKLEGKPPIPKARIIYDELGRWKRVVFSGELERWF